MMSALQSNASAMRSYLPEHLCGQAAAVDNRVRTIWHHDAYRCTTMLRDLDTTMHHIVKTTMQHNVKRLEQGICMGRAWGKHDRYICAASGRPELPAVQLEECSLNCAHSTVTTCNSPVYVPHREGYLT